MASKQPPTLPNEIWIRVLENLNQEQDIPDAWLSCRHVSTAFKAVVESIFRERHLPKTWIVFYLGTHAIYIPYGYQADTFKAQFTMTKTNELFSTAHLTSIVYLKTRISLFSRWSPHRSDTTRPYVDV